MKPMSLEKVASTLEAAADTITDLQVENTSLKSQLSDALNEKAELSKVAEEYAHMSMDSYDEMGAPADMAIDTPQTGESMLDSFLA